MKGKTHLRLLLKDVFGFGECREKATYGLGCKLTLTKNKDDAVIDKVADFAAARIKTDHIHWYVPQYTPSIQQQSFLSKQNLSKTPSELRFIERSFFYERNEQSRPMDFRIG